MLLNRLCLLVFMLYFTSGYSQHIKDIEFGSEESFDIITWNIERFPKAGQATMDSVAQIIQELDAEIFALQEIDDTIKFKEAISKMEDYDTYFKSDFYAGLGYVYKKSEITVTKAYEIYVTPQYWRAFPRSPLILEVLYKDEKYILINNHFKCCGDEILDVNDPDDQETRRLEASNLLKAYIDENFSEDKVVLLGDLNDLINDDPSNNVFQTFIDDHENYLFADMGIANESSEVWSYPWWPSHLDHILITNELFELNANPGSNIETIILDDYFLNGLFEYDAWVSDHRPVGIKFHTQSSSSISHVNNNSKEINIWPNPAFAEINVEISNFDEAKSIKIYNSLGKLIFQQNHPSIEKLNLLNLSKLLPGIHLLVIEKNDSTLECKLIVKY